MTRPEARRRPQAFAAHQIADDFDDGRDAFDPFAPPADDFAPPPGADVPTGEAASITAAEQMGRAFMRLASAITLPHVVVGVACVVATGVVVGLVRRRHQA